jgi:hypothetical protein
VKIIGGRVEDDAACPNGLELLYDQRVSEETLGLGTDGNFDGRDTCSPVILPQLSSSLRHVQSLERVEVVAQRIDQFSKTELLQQTNGQQFRDHSPSLAHASISRILLCLFLELQTVCDKGAYGGSVEVVFADLRLDRLDQKLRDLWRSQLVPGKRSLALLHDQYAAGVGDVV